jgi:hypothetical protein
VYSEAKKGRRKMSRSNELLSPSEQKKRKFCGKLFSIDYWPQQPQGAHCITPDSSRYACHTEVKWEEGSFSQRCMKGSEVK